MTQFTKYLAIRPLSDFLFMIQQLFVSSYPQEARSGESRAGNYEGTEKALPSFLRENICTCLTILLVLCRYFSILCATNPDCHVITATRFYT